MPLVLKNFAGTTLSAAITTGAVTATVADGSKLPVMSSGDFFDAVIINPTDVMQREIVTVTARAGNTITMIRGQEGTTALAFPSNSIIELRITAATMRKWRATEDPCSAEYGAIGDNTLHTVQEWVTSGRFSGLAAIQLVYPHVTALTDSIDWAAIQSALATGKGVVLRAMNRFVVNKELELVTPGQVFAFENTGGWGYGEDIGLNWIPNTLLKAVGTFERRVRTRRLFRGSAADPQDAPLSVVINVQAENVHLIRPAVWLNCDYSNTSPTNLGDDVDVGIFNGCRSGVQLTDPMVIGYFRKAGIYFDVSHATTLPRHKRSNGTVYPMGVNISGADGCGMRNPYVRGPRRGVVILGALPKAGASTYGDPYYDAQLGTTVPDTRGTFGFSDFCCDGGGAIYGPDHHSNRRLKDPVTVGGLVGAASMLLEPDDAPAALQICGMAGNASGGIWGIRFVGTRIATFEAFRVRLGYAARTMFVGCHVEGRNGGRMSTAGVAVNTNDYTATSYGDYAAPDARASRLLIMGSVRTSAADLYPHYYGTAQSAITDYGDTFMQSYRPYKDSADFDMWVGASSMYVMRWGSISGVTVTVNGITFKSAVFSSPSFVAESGTMDIRGATGVLLKDAGAGVTVLTAANSAAVLSSLATSVRSTSGELDLRFGSGSLCRLRNGSTTLATISATTAQLSVSASIGPGSDNAVTAGTAALRYSVVYAGTSQISTSDEEAKAEILPIDDAVLDAWEDVQLYRYLFKDAIEEKGADKARIHCGLVAQRVQAVFEQHGLDPFRYGLLCFDEWETQQEVWREVAEVRDSDGNLVTEAERILEQPFIPAGRRYGIRYEEALCVEAALARRTAARTAEILKGLVQRIEALEK